MFNYFFSFRALQFSSQAAKYGSDPCQSSGLIWFAFLEILRALIRRAP